MIESKLFLTIAKAAFLYDITPEMQFVYGFRVRRSGLRKGFEKKGD